ncbi:hypothetical protein [Streptomyces coeruleorubidus]|uniref:hypothetical protein n=1 Tax=Streptomyces coeruleorubidus TaxID=116188 RepID=UPI0033E22B19
MLFLAWQTLREKGAMKIETEDRGQVKERSASRVTRPKVLAWMRRTFAVAFVGLGVQLVLASR